MTTATRTATAAFADAVRAALGDLPPDERDELLDGLEADLAERLDESPDAADGLGDPLAYAEELRAAAGYPPRPARGHLGDALPDLRTLPHELRRRWEALLQRRPLLGSLTGFVVALRPVWWVLRGLIAYFLTVSVLGVGALGAAWPLAVAAVVLSVQAGRGWLQDRRGGRWLQRAASVVVLVALPFVGGWFATQLNLGISASYDPSASYEYPQGLTSDGRKVDNIFAYDADGRPIDQVQLFDQDGQPLNTVRAGDLDSPYTDAEDGSGMMLVPSEDVPGRPGWNVYPLGHVDSWADYADDGALDPSEISATEFPAPFVKALAGVSDPEQTSGDLAAPAG